MQVQERYPPERAAERVRYLCSEQLPGLLRYHQEQGELQVQQAADKRAQAVQAADKQAQVRQAADKQAEVQQAADMQAEVQQVADMQAEVQQVCRKADLQYRPSCS